jgi:hypothetical protein
LICSVIGTAGLELVDRGEEQPFEKPEPCSDSNIFCPAFSGRHPRVLLARFSFSAFSARSLERCTLIAPAGLPSPAFLTMRSAAAFTLLLLAAFAAVASAAAHDG